MQTGWRLRSGRTNFLEKEKLNEKIFSIPDAFLMLVIARRPAIAGSHSARPGGGAPELVLVDIGIDVDGLVQHDGLCCYDAKIMEMRL